MYATIHEFRHPGGNGPGVREAVANCLPAGADPAGVVAFDDVLREGRCTVVALWGRRAGPPANRSTRSPTRCTVGPRDGSRCSPSSPG